MSPLSGHDLARTDSTIRYWTAGAEDRPAVVFLHSATLDHRAWAPQTDAVQDRFQVVAPDLRGHGDSSGHFAFDAAVDDVIALLERLQAGRVVLVGLSLGATIAREVIRRRPDRVLALVVAGSVARPDSDSRLPVPTLLVHGQYDHTGDIPSGMRAWAQREPLARYAVIQNAGHASNLDDPRAFTALLTAFLAEVLPSRDGDEAYPVEPHRGYGGLVAAGIDGQGLPSPAIR